MLSGNSALARIIRVAVWDLRRQSRRRANILVLALFVLPLVVAVVAKNLESVRVENPTLWASMLGVDIAGEIGGFTLLGSALNLFSWWWLIVALYAGDMLARDMEDGTVYLLASRPLRRWEILAGKVLSVTAVLTVFSVVGAYVVYASAWILAGHQENAWGPLVSALALVAGSLPVLAFGALFGVLTRKTTTSIILVVALVIVSGIVTTLLSIAVLVQAGGGNLTETSLLVASAVPLDGGKHLASTVYTYLARGAVVELPIPAFTQNIAGVTVEIGGKINIARTLEVGVIATAAWTAAVMGLAAWMFGRKDL